MPSVPQGSSTFCGAANLPCQTSHRMPCFQPVKHCGTEACSLQTISPSPPTKYSVPNNRACMQCMSDEVKKNPDTLVKSAKLKRKLAVDSGRSQADVNDLLTTFTQLRVQMKTMTKMMAQSGGMGACSYPMLFLLSDRRCCYVPCKPHRVGYSFDSCTDHSVRMNAQLRVVVLCNAVCSHIGVCTSLEHTCMCATQSNLAHRCVLPTLRCGSRL